MVSILKWYNFGWFGGTPSIIILKNVFGSQHLGSISLTFVHLFLEGQGILAGEKRPCSSCKGGKGNRIDTDSLGFLNHQWTFGPIFVCENHTWSLKYGMFVAGNRSTYDNWRACYSCILAAAIVVVVIILLAAWKQLLPSQSFNNSLLSLILQVLLIWSMFALHWFNDEWVR